MAAFNGFSIQLVNFFQNLNNNNSKQWFEAHRNAEFLFHNGLYAMVQEKFPKLFFSSAVIDYSFSHFQNMLPLHSWLKKAMAK
jgi:uncharacterized protein (DUF2461 family)